MNRKIVAVIAAACILASLGAAASIAYRVITRSAAGEEAARTDFTVLTTILSGVRTAGDLGDPSLRARLSAHFSANPALLTAEVYEHGAGARWRIPADSPYARGGSDAADSLPPSVLRLSSPLPSGAASLAVDAVYVRITQLEVFTAFRDALIFLAGFLALASISLAIASRPRRTRERAQPGAARAKHDGRSDDTVDWDDLLKIDRTAKPARRTTIQKADELEEDDKERDEYDTEEIDRPSSQVESAGHDDKEELFEIPDMDFDEKSGSAKLDSSARNLDLLSDPDIDGDEWARSLPSIPDDTARSTGNAASGIEKPKTEIEGIADIGLEPQTTSDSILLHEDGFENRLQTELERSIASKSDLSVFFVVHDDLTPAVPEYTAFADAVKQAAGAEGIAFERGRSGFAVILPGADSQRALHIARSLFDRLDFLSGGDPGELLFLPLFLGITSRSGRTIDAKSLIAEAEAALKHARDETDSHIVAFKPDPEKYRAFVQSRGR
jgi:GGDEF domain-containing protein